MELRVDDLIDQSVLLDQLYASKSIYETLSSYSPNYDSVVDQINRSLIVMNDVGRSIESFNLKHP